MKLTTQPGKTVTTEVRFKNLNNTPQGIKVGLLRFGAAGEDGQPDLFDLTPKDAFASWVHFEPAELIAQPNVWNTVKVTINVPKDAGLGYYMAVTLSPANLQTQKGAASLRGTAAQLILLNVETGKEQRNVNIASFKTSRGLYEYLPATFTVKLRNNGNIFVSPSGDLFLYKGKKQIGDVNFNPAGGAVLPKSNRVYTITWDQGFPLYKNKLVDGKTIPDKHAVPKQQLSWDFSKANNFRFGRYTAKILVVYDNGSYDVPMEATVNFWVLPWKIMLVLLVLLLIIGLGIFSFVRGLINRGRGHGRGYRR